MPIESEERVSTRNKPLLCAQKTKMSPETGDLFVPQHLPVPAPMLVTLSPSMPPSREAADETTPRELLPPQIRRRLCTARQPAHSTHQLPTAFTSSACKPDSCSLMHPSGERIRQRWHAGRAWTSHWRVGGGNLLSRVPVRHRLRIAGWPRHPRPFPSLHFTSARPEVGPSRGCIPILDEPL